ncbi:hypothetical protein GCM10010199_00920 [Dactylosporangium roseum]
MSVEVPCGDPGADPGAAAAHPGGRLACGADIDDLLERVADRNATELDAHQADRPHCRAALTDLRARGRQFSLAMGSDEHISLELNALLRVRAAHVPRRTPAIGHLMILARSHILCLRCPHCLRRTAGSSVSDTTPIPALDCLAGSAGLRRVRSCAGAKTNVWPTVVSRRPGPS